MAHADIGRGEASVELSVTHADNSAVEAAYERAFLTFDTLPDYEQREEHDRFGLTNPMSRANRGFWRDFGKFVGAYVSTIELRYCLTNRSAFALTGAKLEVTVAQADAKIDLRLGTDLPSIPKPSYNPLDFTGRTFTEVMARRESTMTVENGGLRPICHIRLGNLLPGETARAADTLAVRLRGPGRVTVTCRILASELSTPIEHQLEFGVTGAHSKLDLDGLQTFVKEPLAQSLLARVIAQANKAE